MCKFVEIDSSTNYPKGGTLSDVEKEKMIDNLGKAKEDHKQEEKKQGKTKPYPLLPQNLYQFITIAMGVAAVNYYSLWLPVSLVYMVVVPLNPVCDLRLLLDVFTRAVSGRFGDLPLRFNAVGLVQMLWGILVRGPVECFLWYLDELLFPDYASCTVKDPVFMLGQPRSGTTKLLDVMALDSERFCALTMSEIRFPFLCLQYVFAYLSHFDKTVLDGKVVKFMKSHGLYTPMPEGVPEREKMRRINWDLHDEDEIMFMYHGFSHFMLAGFFPDPELIQRFYQFNNLPERSQRRFLQFHHKAVQKMLYRRGAGRTYMAKWVAGWNGQLDQAKIEYPDAKFVVIARDRAGSLRSWMKLQSLLSLEISHNNVMDIHEARQAIVDANKNWFHKEIEFCQNTPKNSLHVMRFSDFVENIPREITRIYDFLGKNIAENSDFYYALQNEHRKQTGHKKTVVRGRELYISDEEIEEFPDLLAELKFS